MAGITYQETKDFTVAELERLFLSVGWDSGRYPDRLKRGMKNSSQVISAWDGDKLIGLVRGLDDGETVAFLHYLLVDPDYQGQHIGQELMERILEKYKHMLHVKIMPSDPKTIPFYERFGFAAGGSYTAMELNQMQ